MKRPVVPLLIEYNGISLETYALIDTGANISALSLSASKRLKVLTKRMMMKLGTFGRKGERAEKEIARFTIKSLIDDFTIIVNDALISAELTTGSEKCLSNEDIKQYEFMDGVELIELERDSIDLILSAKYAYHFFCPEIKKGYLTNHLLLTRHSDG